MAIPNQRSNEFEDILKKLGYRPMGGGAVGGKSFWSHPSKEGMVVALRIHPMDGRVLNYEVTQNGNTIANGEESRQLLNVLQDTGGSGAFRKVSYDTPSNKTGGHPFRDKFKAATSESLEQYDNNIERAISEIFQLDEQSVKQLVTKMKFEEYLNLAIALDQEDIKLAERILSNYGISTGNRRAPAPAGPTPESVTEYINYLTKNDEDNIITPELRQLKENEQREVLDLLLNSQLQKMLANLRGYAEPGMYENALFSNMLKDAIMEAIPNAPNRPNGAADDERLEKDAEVAVADNTGSGETEDGTVVNDTGNSVTVQTKKGRRTVKKDELMQPVVDEDAFDLKRMKELAGIKTIPEEIEEEEDLTEDESLGEEFTLEIDGEEIKKSDDSEELIDYGREEFTGKEWMIYDSQTGEIAADWEGEGYLQDAAKSSRFRLSKEPGWERKEKLARTLEPDNEPTEDWIDDEPEEDKITDKEATIIADRVMMAIGENWPDGDPAEAAIKTIRKALGMKGDMYDTSFPDIDQNTMDKIKGVFTERHGGDFYEYFDELTQQMQGDNPGEYGDVPKLVN